jgi:RNA polymerase sigma factor (sigma-70 family)
MQTDTNSSFGYDPDSETTWAKLYQTVRPLAKYLVYTASIPLWRGQETDIAEDITQQTMLRLIDYLRKVERGAASPIASLEQMARTIAWNYYRDLWRKEHRIEHLPLDSDSSEDRLYQFDVIASQMETSQITDPAMIIEEEDYHEHLFQLLAQQIVHFPPRQQIALLMDLANHMSFDIMPTALERAFLAVGVLLRNYRHLPSTPGERNRHTSLLAHAYKRIANMQIVTMDNNEIVGIRSTIERRDGNGNTSLQTKTEEDIGKNSMLENDLQSVDTNSELADSIRKLPEPYQAVVLLHILKRWTYSQIASYLKLSKGTIKSQISRGMKMLHQQKEQKKETNLPKIWYEASVHYRDDPNALMARVDNLPEPYQTAIRLHYVKKLTYPQIMEQLGLPKGTIKSQVSRGMKMLAK